MPSLAQALRTAPKAQRLVSRPEGRRAAIAAIFCPASSSNGVANGNTVRGNEELILFIKRASNARDAWSGHIAFPGGLAQLQDGDEDERTAMREALEEVGLDLADRSRWLPLGRLCEDRTLYPRGSELTISLFGFTALEPVAELPLCIQTDEARKRRCTACAFSDESRGRQGVLEPVR